MSRMVVFEEDPVADRMRNVHLAAIVIMFVVTLWRILA